MLGQHAADGRAEQARDAPDRAEEARDLGALGQAVDVAEDRLGARLDAARADALHDAEHDQLGHVLRQAAQDGAEQEQQRGRQKDPLASEQVGQFAVHGHRDRAGEQVGAEDPRVAGNPASCVTTVGMAVAMTAVSRLTRNVDAKVANVIRRRLVPLGITFIRRNIV